MPHRSDHSGSAGPDEPTYPQVRVQLAGTDGNAYAVIAAVARQLRRQVGADAATDFTTAAFAC
ncbi:hypothetical protein AB0M20_25580, partial [Actinoplanes sp. NPDC051633]|uniref:hypothetical protein n=1 Tax=Actinoplanes sp. NPDC051633 TaxID=3155670 RepID=UPI00342FE562